MIIMMNNDKHETIEIIYPEQTETTWDEYRL